MPYHRAICVLNWTRKGIQLLLKLIDHLPTVSLPDNRDTHRYTVVMSWCACVLACLCAGVPCAGVPMCLVCLCACVLVCLCAWCAYVLGMPMCLVCLCAWCACVLVYLANVLCVCAGVPVYSVQWRVSPGSPLSCKPPLLHLHQHRRLQPDQG